MRTEAEVCALALAAIVFLGSAPSLPGAAVAPRRLPEAWALYDDFNAGPINPDKWWGSEWSRWGEENRRIAGTGLLRMRYTSYAGTASNTGGWHSGLHLNFMNPDAITQIQATTRVQNWAMVGCPGNTDTETRTRILIYGSFFNAGTPTPGSNLDNVYAYIMLRRRVGSTDGPDLFRAEAYRCTDATCTTRTSLGFLTLGLVPMGTFVTLSVIWDQPNHQFIYQFAGAPPITQPYAWSDTNPPSYVFKQLSIVNSVPNCTSPPRPFAFMSGRYDDVYVNASAAAAVARGLRTRGNSPPYDIAPR